MNNMVKFHAYCACGAHWSGTLPSPMYSKAAAAWDAEHKPGTDARGIFHGPATRAQCLAARAKAERKQP